MTIPGESGEPDRIPTQAELDAEDMAEIARRSKDADHRNRYPSRPVDPGPAPAALTRHAPVLWAVAAVACLTWMIYGFVELGTVERLMVDRLLPGLTEMKGVDPTEKAESLASFWIPALLIGIPLVTLVTYPLLRAIASSHSRNLRSIYAAVVVVTVLFVIVGADLLFAYPELPAFARIAAWVQCGALVLSVIVTMRGVVSAWLPPSMTIRPFRRA
ncbi:hypothetical protein [Gordonia shandongensis]|uniref:hypothetical protein n=1 Tax=Gordonia shandongensis TaxID=376351 RepID=UPI00041EA38C|nr:hypothetical protein [Gordonia shandongensis]